MAWTLVYTASAARAIREMNPAVRRRVGASLQRLREEPERGKPPQLALQRLLSWRMVDYRIVYRVIEARIEVLFVSLGDCRDVYDKLHDTWSSRQRGTPPCRCRADCSLECVENSIPSARKRNTAATLGMCSSTPQLLPERRGRERFC